MERRGEKRKNGSGGKEKVDSTSHDVVKVCAGGRWKMVSGDGCWMVDGGWNGRGGGRSEL